MRIAVLGLGLMGSAIARRLADAGHELYVWNRSDGRTGEFESRGAQVLASPAEALKLAELCIVMLADGAALEQVALGPDGVLCDGASGTLMDMSTISMETSAGIAAKAERRGVTFLRAPVSGNPGVVAAGNLGIIVSGPRAAFDALSPTLLDIGPNLFYVGEAEQSRAVKLALNLMIGGTAELLSEALVLAEENGIGRREVLEVIAGSAVGSPFVRYKTEPLVAGDYTATFTARLLAKDLGLALACGRAAGVPLPVTEKTEELVQDAIARGLGEDDLMVLLPRLRQAAGLDA
jgi:3-hydroxyisobutyrate dehydrogenase-like beta-hydroxyacid dehydrogenase